MGITTVSMKEHALEYISKGWRVAPLHWPVFDESGAFKGCSCGKSDCDSPGKHPFAKLVPHGLRDATTDRATVETWWDAYPLCNIAIATGPESDLVMIGPDDEPGPSNWAAMQALHGEIVTATARSGRASGTGAHILTKHPGIYIKNQVSKDGSNIDIRGDGGYFVAAPSLHQSGRRYEWTSKGKVAEMPVWLLNWLVGGIYPLPQEDGQEVEKVIDPQKKVFDRDGKVASLSKYAEAGLRGEIDRVLSAKEGDRNNTLNRSAFSLGTLVGAGMLDEGTARAELEAAARKLGLSDTEIAKTISSGLSAGKGKPRPEPEPRDEGPVAPPPPPVDGPPDVQDDAVQDYLARAPKTETGNAEVFAYLFGDRVRYCTDAKTWMVWNGAVWAEDKTNQVDRLMLQAIRHRRDAGNRQAALGRSDAEREAGLALAAWAMRQENQKPILNSLDRAKTLEQIVTLISQYDADPLLLTAGDVTINLRDGSVRAPRPTDYITRRLGVAYDQNAQCPRWMNYLEEVWPNQPRVWDYMRRVVGYSLTGETREQVFFMLLGYGSNGKSILTKILKELGGEHYATTPFDTFDADKRNNSSEDLAELRGRRVVVVSEVDEGRRLAEARVKSVTGQNMISCRFLYGKRFEYRPTFKVFMEMNHLPAVTGTDDGIWRRIHLVKFSQRFWKPGDERREGDRDADLQLEQKLMGELAGILNWAIQGAMEWQEQGLAPSAEVSDLTRQYRSESDLLGQWADARLTTSIGAKLYSKDGYADFKAWSEEMGFQRPWTQISWSKQMVEHGYRKSPRPDRTGPYFDDVSLATISPTVRFD